MEDEDMKDEDMKDLLPKFKLVPVLGIAFFIFIVAMLVISIHDDLTVIDTRVETIEGTIYDCTEANSDHSGMTYIGKPYRVSIPTRRIKIISNIK